jgi:hypothetical protein
MRLLAAQGRYERSVRFAARRAAEEAANVFGDQWAHHRMVATSAPITGLVYRIGQLIPECGGKIPSGAASDLRSAAQAVERELRQWSPPFLYTTEPARAENIRLRQAALKTAQLLHTLHGDSDRDAQPCLCPGCELIRDLDDVPTTDTAATEALHTAQAQAAADAAKLRPPAKPGPPKQCPDGGTCHHWCGQACFRVMFCEPLSAANYPGDQWPGGLVGEHHALSRTEAREPRP